MTWATCDSCGHPNDCDEQSFETVDENGDTCYEIGHVCDECLNNDSD